MQQRDSTTCLFKQMPQLSQRFEEMEGVFDGIPVLFIPGNSGSYKQGKSNELECQPFNTTVHWVVAVELPTDIHSCFQN